MSKTVTIRLNDQIYRRFRKLAEQDNRPLSNFIETAAIRYLQNEQFVDELEMDEIRATRPLNESVKRGFRDSKMRRGRFA